MREGGLSGGISKDKVTEEDMILLTMHMSVICLFLWYCEHVLA